MFLRDGEVEIFFNGELLSYEEPKVQTSTPAYRKSDAEILWRKPISFALPTGEKISGFAGIRETGSTHFAGFALFRQRRLILGSDDDSYRPSAIFGASNSFTYQRLFGELSLDDFPVSHTKDAFVWGELEEPLIEALKRAVDEEPLALIKQADSYRKKQSDRDSLAAAEDAVRKTTEALTKSVEVISQQAEAEPVDNMDQDNIDPENVSGKKTLEIDLRNQKWLVTVELTTNASDREWLTVKRYDPIQMREARSAELCLNLSHPYTLKYGGTSFCDIESLVNFGAALGIAEITAREAGVAMSGTIRRNVNELLRELSAST